MFCDIYVRDTCTCQRVKSGQLYSAIRSVKVYAAGLGYPVKFADFLSSKLSDVVGIWDEPIRTLFPLRHQ